jgi:hypothetical protein
MYTENQYDDQAPGCFSTIVGNRDTATAAYSMGRGAGVQLYSSQRTKNVREIVLENSTVSVYR